MKDYWKGLTPLGRGLVFMWIVGAVAILTACVIRFMDGKYIRLQSPVVIEKISPMSEAEQLRQYMLLLEKQLDEQRAREAIRQIAAVERWEDIRYAIVQYANLYDVDPYFALCVAKNESGFRLNAVGDNGASVGPFQFKLATWQMFRKMMGKDTADRRTSLLDSTETAIWAFSKGYQSHWSAARGCY